MLSKLFDLSGRVALVTGGSKGLGKAMARGFAEAGADVVISSRHEDELQAAAGDPVRLDGAGRVRRRRHESVATRPTSSPRRPSRRMGRVDILVNNAGSNLPQPIDQIRDEDWDRLVELNLSSCMALTRALVPFMKERRWGRIIHISSIMGFSSAGGRNAYSATKSALLGLARASANDLGPVRHHRQLHRPRPVPDRPAHEPALRGAAGRIRPPNRPGPLGPTRRAGRPRPPPGQRRRQLHHRRLAHRRRRQPGEDLLRTRNGRES